MVFGFGVFLWSTIKIVRVVCFGDFGRVLALFCFFVLVRYVFWSEGLGVFLVCVFFVLILLRSFGITHVFWCAFRFFGLAGFSL